MAASVAGFFEVNTRLDLPAGLQVGRLYFIKDEGVILVNHGDRQVSYGGGSGGGGGGNVDIRLTALEEAMRDIQLADVEEVKATLASMQTEITAFETETGQDLTTVKAQVATAQTELDTFEGKTTQDILTVSDALAAVKTTIEDILENIDPELVDKLTALAGQVSALLLRFPVGRISTIETAQTTLRNILTAQGISSASGGTTTLVNRVTALEAGGGGGGADPRVDAIINALGRDGYFLPVVDPIEILPPTSGTKTWFNITWLNGVFGTAPRQNGSIKFTPKFACNYANTATVDGMVTALGGTLTPIASSGSYTHTIADLWECVSFWAVNLGTTTTVFVWFWDGSKFELTAYDKADFLVKAAAGDFDVEPRPLPPAFDDIGDTPVEKVISATATGAMASTNSLMFSKTGAILTITPYGSATAHTIGVASDALPDGYTSIAGPVSLYDITSSVNIELGDTPSIVKMVASGTDVVYTAVGRDLNDPTNFYKLVFFRESWRADHTADELMAMFYQDPPLTRFVKSLPIAPEYKTLTTLSTGLRSWNQGDGFSITKPSSGSGLVYRFDTDTRIRKPGSGSEADSIVNGSTLGFSGVITTASANTDVTVAMYDNTNHSYFGTLEFWTNDDIRVRVREEYDTDDNVNWSSSYVTIWRMS
jgi:hypothetical protein